MTDNKKFVYNINVADFLMKYVRCWGTGINKKSGSTFWVFDYDEIQPYYELYNKNKLSNREK